MEDRFEKRIEKVETKMEAIDQRQNKIENQQAETRVYVKQIFDRMDDIKLMVQTGSKKSTSPNKEWIDLVKWIIGGTIFVMVAAQFVNYWIMEDQYESIAGEPYAV